MESYIVAEGDIIKASEYNKLRDDIMPVGSVVMWSKTTAPDQWIICDGSAINRITYATLFALIGITFGSGDGVNTFNVPDCRESFVVGKSGTYAIGATGGGTHTIITAELPTHLHSITADTGHSHHVPVMVDGSDTWRWTHRGTTAGRVLTTSDDVYYGGVPHNHGGATATTGSGTAIVILPEYIALVYIIKY